MKYSRFLLTLFSGLLCLLAACGDVPGNVATATAGNSGAAVSVLKELERALNQGDVAGALELFDPQAEIVEVQPSYWVDYEGTGTFYSRRLSTGDQVSYKGKDLAKTYLFTLVHSKFQSSESTYWQEGDKAIWECQTWLYDATLQMEFNARIEAGRIKFLTITNRNLQNLDNR